MTYRVVFSKRFQSDGRESTLDPTTELDALLADGVVADKSFVERFESDAQHSQEVLDEDDSFLGMAGAEVWEYEVLDERAGEFEDAIRNSPTIMEFEVVDGSPTDTADLTDSTRFAPSGDAESSAEDTSDNPAGATGDPSAGGMTPGRPYLGLGEVANDSGGLEDLSIVNAGDPHLGLTNYGHKGPKDWAADVGATRVADRGMMTADLTDDESTLAPDEPLRRR
jgi:hypothetical protein